MKYLYTLLISIVILSSLLSFIITKNPEMPVWMFIAICLSPVCVALDCHDNKNLQKTKEAKRYNKEYDSFYDDKKDIWLEEKCDQKNCEFCKNRPSKPSEVKE